MIKLKVKKGDQVIVRTGKDKGKKGQILAVFPADNKVLVSGINLVKKHNKPSRESEGGISTKEMPVNISNISLLDPKTGEPTKVGFKILKDGKKVRFARKSGEIFESEGKKWVL